MILIYVVSLQLRKQSLFKFNRFLFLLQKPNLILNVDGLIGVAFVDLLRNCGCFTEEEAREYVQIGALNAIFVLGRSMGFIGHYLDQKRLKQGLYRHPWDDISYVLPETYD